MLGVQCAYKDGSVAILIVPALVLLPPSNCTRIPTYSEINTIIPESMCYLENANFASHPSICIVKKIIIFVKAINIPNGTGKDHQYILNNAHDMILTQYFMVPASYYKKAEANRRHLKVR